MEQSSLSCVRRIHRSPAKTSTCQTIAISVPSHPQRPPKRTTFHCAEHINAAQLLSDSPQHFIFIRLILSICLFSIHLFKASMKTRHKNKSAHPGVPDMTQSQLTSSGLSGAPNARPPLRRKRQTKAQEILALQEELRVTRELMISNVANSFLSLSVVLTSFFLEPFQHTRRSQRTERYRAGNRQRRGQDHSRHETQGCRVPFGAEVCI